MEGCFDLLSGYFGEDGDLARVNLVHELFTTPDLMRRAELLLTQDLGEMALSKAWTDLMTGDRDITLLAYTALQVESRRPGTVPQELLASLSEKVGGEKLGTRCVARLEGDAVEYIGEVEELLDRDTDLARLVACQHVSALTGSGNLNPESIERTRKAIAGDIARFDALLGGGAQPKGGREAA